MTRFFRFPRLSVLAASVAMTAFAATAHAQDEPAGTSYLAVRQPAAVPRGQRALGHGSHAYQFVVRDPQAIDPKTAMPVLGVSERDAVDMSAYLLAH